MVERVERRVLGAVRFVDAATGAPVTDPLEVRAPGARLVRNLRGFYVIAEAPQLAAHTLSFVAPPGAPALGTAPLAIEVRDPARRYLPRVATIPLPRDPAQEHLSDAGSLFRPADVRLFPAPAAPASRAWAVVRATVVDADHDVRRLAGALIRIRRKSGGPIIARGLSDARGEALVPVPGIAVTAAGESTGAVVEFKETVTVEVIWDPAQPELPDPDGLESNPATLKTATSDVDLASGKETTVTLPVKLA